MTDSASKQQIFDANTSGSYLSANDPRIVVGLGAATGVKSLKVQWPSGRVQVVNDPAIDRYLVLNEPDSEPL